MKKDIEKEIQDLTWLQWSHIRSSSGTAGTLLKSQSVSNGKKTYYKLSSYEPGIGITGHECINEIIAARLLTQLGVDHLSYRLIHAKVEIDHQEYITWLCASEDFKQRGESKIALDDYYRLNALPKESPYAFCTRMGWQDTIDQMIAVDYLILNRDRHGANIEILRNARARTLRIAPLFDHGLSFLFSCHSDEAIRKFNGMEDKRCQNFIGSFSCLDNLKYLQDPKHVFPHSLHQQDKAILFNELDGILSRIHLETLWDMLWKRYTYYENL